MKSELGTALRTRMAVLSFKKPKFYICRGGNSVGSGNLKLNFKLIQGRKIGTIINGQRNVIGTLKEVFYEKNEKQYRMSMENGFTFYMMQDAFFYHTILRYENDCVFFEFSKPIIFSGMIAYSLFETYGLPLEFVADDMNRKGIPLDEKGFHILAELQRIKNKDTFRNKNTF